MNHSDIHDSFLQLVRLGIGASNTVSISGQIDWPSLQALADQQGLSAVVLDGVECLPDSQRPPQVLLLQWIGETLQGEAICAEQQQAAIKMADLYHSNYIRTYVLKGAVVAECYPKPNHRFSEDMDCFLLPEQGVFDAWELGNDLIKAHGYEVKYDFYKNSTFYLPGLTVENHRFLTPFRGNKRLASLENVLQAYLKQDKGLDIIEGTRLYRPPVMVTALFLIEHAYSHFLHEGLTWRHVLDWMMFSKKHQKDINWTEFDVFVDEFGFRKFYNSFSQLGKYLIGEIQESDFTKVDKKMLADIWAPLDLHDTVRGFKGKLALAGNTWRARWKYRYFAEMSWVTALWIQVKGFLFIKEPRLN